MANDFSLSKHQIVEFDKHQAALTMAHETLTAAIDAYNAVVEDAEAFITGVAEDFRSAWDEKSERWQESDRGQEVGEFIETWEAISIEQASAPERNDELAALEKEI